MEKMIKSEGKNLITTYSWFNDTAVIEEFLYSIDEIALNLPEDIALLGLGSGVGNLDYAVKQHLEEKYNKVVRMTITDRYTADTVKREGVRVLDVENKSLPFTNESFDLVIARSVTHYEKTKEDESSVLTEIKRVLKPNGIFITEAPFFSNKNDVELLKKIHSLVSKNMNLKTYDELVSLHKEIFSSVLIATKQPSIPLKTEKTNFNKRYGISEGDSIDTEITKLISAYRTQDIASVWSRDNDFGWTVNFAILINQK